MYSDAAGSTACTACAAGYVTSGDLAADHDSSEDCVACEAGTYAYEGACLVCPVGMYSSDAGATTCTACPGGTTVTSSSDGSESSADHDSVDDCVACAAGTHRANASVTQQARLVGGGSAYEGRVEVDSPADDMWGSVDANYWDSADAEVVCRSLGMGVMV